MSPELIFHVGIVICGVSVAGAIAVTIVIRVYKSRLNKQLDAEYGKRRH